MDSMANLDGLNLDGHNTFPVYGDLKGSSKEEILQVHTPNEFLYCLVTSTL